MWGCTLAEAMSRCDSREFAEWQAYDLISPIGRTRDDYMLALVAAFTANAFRGKNAKVMEPTDIIEKLPWPWKPASSHAKEVMAKMDAIGAQYGMIRKDNGR